MGRQAPFASTQAGIFQWQGSEWDFLTDETRGLVSLGTSRGVFTHGYYERGPAQMIAFNGTFLILGNNQPMYTCVGAEQSDFATPDNGNRLYAIYQTEKVDGDCSSGEAEKGVATIIPDPNKPKPVSNLHLRTGTYIGGSAGGNEAVGVAIGQDFNIYVAGKFGGIEVDDPGQITGNVNQTLFSTTPFQSGKLVRYNMFGDTILEAVTVGNHVEDFEMQNFAPFNMVISGDFGVAVLDGDLNMVWRKTFAQVQSDLYSAGGTYDNGLGVTLPYPKVDIDDAGRVVVAMGSKFAHRWMVYNPAGVLKGTPQTFFLEKLPDFPNVGQEYVEDITIKNDTVYGCGFNNGYLDANCTGGPNVGTKFEVQSGWVKSWYYDGADYVDNFMTWGIPGELLTWDQADTRIYRINVGKDGKLYALGEAAGGNSVFRWNGKQSIEKNGCTNPASTLVQYDPYNAPTRTRAAHIAYFCTIDPFSGDVERGQYIIPRASDGYSNSYRVRNGSIHADEEGFVYIGAQSSATFNGRETQTINGKLLGDYSGGDMAVLIIAPDYRQRQFWGSFMSEASRGSVVGVGIRENMIAVAGNLSFGKNYTGAEKPLMVTGDNCDYEFRDSYAPRSEPFHYETSDSNPNDDAYLAVWYQDIWNFATCDTIEIRPLPSDTVVSRALVNQKADFIANPRDVCVNEITTFTNASVGDSTGHSWQFGAGANLFDGTAGPGPHAVKYSTSGYKTIRLEAILKGNTLDFNQKSNYITVLPDNLVLSNLQGADTVCAGATVFYDVEPVDGVDFLEWQLPSDAQILAGQGSRTIKASFFTSGGLVRVRGHYACGTTPWLSMNVEVKSPNSNAVLLVTADGSSNITPAEQEVIDTLQAEGFNVELMPDHQVDGFNAACYGLVIIMPSTDPDVLEYKLREVPVPIISMNRGNFPYLNLTDGLLGTTLGYTIGTDIELIEDGHEATNIGASAGDNLNLYSVADTIYWGVPSSQAEILTSVPLQPSRATIFTYEKGATMRGFVAPERRAGFAMNLNGYLNDGTHLDTLFKRMLCWTTRTCPTDRTITTLDPEFPKGTVDTVFCIGDSIYIPYNKTGDFLGNVPDKSNPFYTREVDDSDLGTFNLDGTKRFWLSGAGWKSRSDASAIDNSYYDDNKTTPIISGTYQPYVYAEGKYAVEVHVPDPGFTPGVDSASSGVPVYIKDANGNEILKFVNQQVVGWARLDTVHLKVGTGQTITISNAFNGDSLHTLLDAVRIVPIELNPVGNIFTAYISNSVGNFFQKTELNFVQDTANETIAAKLPDDLPTGDNYKIRVESSLPSIVGQPNYATITIQGEPQKPGVIIGPATACKNNSVNTYRINQVPGVTQYIWRRPLGTTFTSHSDAITVTTADTAVTIDFGNATNGNIQVRTRNSCAESNSTDGFSELLVTISGNPPVAPATLGGADTVCRAASQTYFYSVSAVFGAAKYGWVLPAGASIVGCDTCQSVEVNFTGTVEQTDSIGAYAISDCGNGDTLFNDVLIDDNLARPKVGSINSVRLSCKGQYSYSVIPPAGIDYFKWVLPSGALLTSGDSTAIVSVTYPAPISGDVRVVAVNGCGESDTSRLSVNIVNDTSDLKVNLGPDQDICGTITLDAGEWPTYSWSTGRTGRFASVGTTDTVIVVVADGSGCSTSDSVILTAQGPAVPVGNDVTVPLGTCGDANVELSATGGDNFYWYDSDTATTPLDSGLTFIAQAITSDTNFYVSQFDYANQQTSNYLDNSAKKPDGLMTNSGAFFTMEFWVRTDASGVTTTEDMFLERGTVEMYVGINRGTASVGEVGVQIKTDAGLLSFVGGTEIDDQGWHHVAVVYDNGNARLYIDGLLDGSGSLGTTWILDSESDLNLGATDLDEFRFWTVARTQSEIQTYMNKSVSPQTSGLYGYCTFNEDPVFQVGTGDYHFYDEVTASYPEFFRDASYNVATVGGPLIAEVLCESGRDQISITIDEVASNPVQTNDYVVCNAGDSVLVTVSGGSGQYRWYTQDDPSTPFDTASKDIWVKNITVDTMLAVSSYDFSAYSTSRTRDGNASAKGFQGFGCLSSGTEMSVEFWMKSTTASGPEEDHIYYHDHNDFDISVSNGRLVFKIDDVAGSSGAPEELATKIIITDNKWRHFACVFDSGQATIFINGNVDTTRTLGFTTFGQGDCSGGTLGGQSALMGRRGANDKDFNGWIDEAKGWDKALTSDEIKSNMYRCIPGFTSNLLFYYRFEDETSGGQAPIDETGGSTVIPSGFWSDYDVNGEDLACGVCESPRDTINISLRSGDLFTKAMDDTVICAAEPMVVPASVCQQSDICQWLYGAPHNYIEFNNDAGDVEVAESNANTPAEINGANPRTVEAWVRIPSGATDQHVFVTYGNNTTNGDRFTLRMNDNSSNGNIGGFRFEVNGGYKITNTLINDGLWHHVAVVIPNMGVPELGDARMYIDGIEQGYSGTNGTGEDITTVADRITIGNDFRNADFTVDIGGVRIWSTDFTTDQINQYKDSLIMGSAPNLEYNYNLTTTGGTTLVDASGNNRDASMLASDITVFSGATTIDDPSDWYVGSGPSFSGLAVPYFYYIELSDENGSFASPVVISDTIRHDEVNLCGNLVADLQANMPDVVTVGTGYKVRVVAVDSNYTTTIVGDEVPNTLESPINRWTGDENDNWTNERNWTCQVPDSGNDAYIPLTVTEPYIYADSGLVEVREIILDGGSSLTLESGADLNLYSHLDATNGTINDFGSTISFLGSAHQEVRNVSSLGSVTINNPNGVSIDTDLSIAGIFDLTRGVVTLGSNNINLCTSLELTPLVNGGANAFFAMDDNADSTLSGYVFAPVPGNGVDFLIPVGNGSAYTPVYVNNTGSNACIRSRTFSNVYHHGFSGPLYTQEMVNRSWEVSPQDPGVIADVTLQWNDADEAVDFDRSEAWVVKNRGVEPDTQWVELSSSLVTGASQPYTITAYGISSFSTFAVTNFDVLPLSLVAFNAQRTSQQEALISWITASETNVDYMEVQKSLDGRSFTGIGRVAANNLQQTSRYSLVDTAFEQTSYYRLKIVDFDGKNSFSQIRVLKLEQEGSGAFVMFPNPYTPNTHIEFAANAENQINIDNMHMRILNGFGRTVRFVKGDLRSLNRNLTNTIDGLPNGLYFIHLSAGNERAVLKLVKH